MRSFLENTLSQLKKMFILVVSACWQVMLADTPTSCSSHYSAMTPEQDSFVTYLKVRSSSKATKDRLLSWLIVDLSSVLFVNY